MPDAAGNFRGFYPSRKTAEAWDRIFGGAPLSPETADVIHAARRAYATRAEPDVPAIFQACREHAAYMRRKADGAAER